MNPSYLDGQSSTHACHSKTVYSMAQFTAGNDVEAFVAMKAAQMHFSERRISEKSMFKYLENMGQSQKGKIIAQFQKVSNVSASLEIFKPVELEKKPISSDKINDIPRECLTPRLQEWVFGVNGVKTPARRSLENFIESHPRLRNQHSSDVGYYPRQPPYILFHYAEPARLPAPTAEIEEFGHQKYVFGSARVLKQYGADYQAIRLHMVNSGIDAQNVLATIENRDNIITDIYPYKNDEDVFIVLGKKEKKEAKVLRKIVDCDQGKTRAVVLFGLDEARFTLDGGFLSPATTAAHELTHAAEDSGNLSEKQIGKSQYLDEEVLRYKNRRENSVICGVEADVAWANGEALRDGHGIAGIYLVAGNVQDTAPMDWRVNNIIQAAKYDLVKKTDEINAGLLKKPKIRAKKLNELYSSRKDIADKARADLSYYANNSS